MACGSWPFLLAQTGGGEQCGVLGLHASPLLPPAALLPARGVKLVTVPLQPGVMGEGNQIRAVLDKSLRGSRAAENKVSARIWLMTAGQAAPGN